MTRPIDALLALSPHVMEKLKAATMGLFNPPNGDQLLRMHKEVMEDPETQRLIQEMADEALASEPCSETVQ